MTAHDMNSVNVNVLVLEDEPDLLENIRLQLDEGLKDLPMPTIVQNEFSTRDKTSRVSTPIIRCVDNLSQARKLVHSGKCEVFVADYRVKADELSEKNSTSVLPLLKEIRARRAFIPVIGHTAFQDLYIDANKDSDKIVTYAFSKCQFDSTACVVKKGVELSKTLLEYKHILIAAFECLKEATEQVSPIEKQQLLERSRYLFGMLKAPESAPNDYRKALTSICNCLLRVSSVPSERFRLGTLSPELIAALQPVVNNLVSPFFSYRNDGMPAFRNLEAMGFDVIMRIDI